MDPAATANAADDNQPVAAAAAAEEELEENAAEDNDNHHEHDEGSANNVANQHQEPGFNAGVEPVVEDPLGHVTPKQMDDIHGERTQENMRHWQSMR